MGKRSSSNIAADLQTTADKQANALVVVTLVVMVLALVRSFIMVSPQVEWDVDPRSSSAVQGLIGIGPIGSAWFDVLSVLASAGAMYFHHVVGGKLGVKSAVLAVIGGAVCLWQLPRYGPGMMTAGSWVAAMSLAMATYHLAQHRRPRLVITAMLAAVMIPWMLKSLVYVYWDHAMTLELFLKDEAKSVAARGWKLGSPQHLLFKRRLEFPDATGSYGLSNVYGSVVIAIGMISAGLGAVSLRGRNFKHAALPGALFVMSLVTLYYTHSKGAAVAMAMGIGLLGLVVLSWRWKKISGLIAPAAMVCVVLAVGLVLARGAMGPPDSDQGERSLLFRYHYWQASARMVLHEPWEQKLLGVGPGSFKDSYILYKNPLNPEEVTSSHNMAIDFITMLGLGGVAWSLLFLGWLWTAGRATGRWCAASHTANSGRADEAGDDSALVQTSKPAAGSGENAADIRMQIDRDVKLVLAATLALFGFQFYTQFATMLAAEQFLSWAMGAVGFIGVVVLLGSDRWTKPAAAQMALFLGAAVLLIHNQIEMGFFNAQAGQLVFVIVAAAAGASVNFADTHGKDEATEVTQNGLRLTGPLAMMLVLIVGAGVMVVTYALPQTKQQTALTQAADLLRGGQHMQSIKALDEAILAMPRDPRPYDSKVMLLVEAAMYYSKENQPGPAQQLMSQAMVTLDAAFAAGLDEVSLVRRRAQLLEASSQMFNDTGRMTTAINVWQSVMERSPYAVMDALHLADLLWDAGRKDEAARWYERTLKLDGNNYLDPAKQLLPEQKAHVEARLAERKS